MPSGYRQLAETVLEQLEGQVEGCLVYTTIFDSDANVYGVVAARGDRSLGIDGGLELPLDATFCFRMATDQGPRLSLDPRAEPAYSEIDPDGSLGTYAGSPIELEDGTRIGSLCVVSREAGAVDPSIVPVLSILAGILASALEREREVERLRSANADLRDQAATDALTGVANRRVLDAALASSWQLARSGQMPSYLVVADLDLLKQINDEHGHVTGDLALTQLAASLDATARGSDVVGRVGGDEFAVILRGCSSDADADAYCLRAQEELGTRMLMHSLPCTVSVGYASLDAASSPQDVLERADRAMYERKRMMRGGGS